MSNSNYKFTVNGYGVITRFTHLNESVTDIVIPAEIGGVKVKGMGYKAFYNNRFITSVTISEGVTSIGVDAFKGCSALTSVTIPSSVTSIGVYAFTFCSSLTDVYYNGTPAQWNKIYIVGKGNSRLAVTNIHFVTANANVSCESIYQQAISHFGEQHQENMTIEECAELIQAINKKHRGLNHNIAEEIADVEIMLTQLKIINNCNLEVEKIKTDKLLRLRDRLIKQTPKKVTHEATLFECPTCPNCKNVVGEFISKGHYATTPYCRFCGQALDWGDENA